MLINDYLFSLPRGLKGKGSPFSITERRVPELIPVKAVSLQVT